MDADDPIIGATEDHPAIYRDGHRLTASPPESPQDRPMQKSEPTYFELSAEDGIPHMAPRASGTYVRRTDYESTLAALRAENDRLRKRADEGHAAHAASFGALVDISLLTDLGGEVDDYAAVVKAVASLRAQLEAAQQNAAFDLDAFSAENFTRCTSPTGFNHALASWSLSDWMTATLGELGEAANVAKKLNRVRDGITGNRETEEQLRAKLGSEIADAFIYLDLLSQSQGLRLSEIVRRTFDAKSAEIGYAARVPETPEPTHG